MRRVAILTTLLVGTVAWLAAGVTSYFHPLKWQSLGGASGTGAASGGIELRAGSCVLSYDKKSAKPLAEKELAVFRSGVFHRLGPMERSTRWPLGIRFTECDYLGENLAWSPPSFIHGKQVVLSFSFWVTAIPIGFGWAGIAFVLLRPRRRRRRGQCVGCGYDLTGNASGRCPECGCEVVAVRKPRSPSGRG